MEGPLVRIFAGGVCWTDVAGVELCGLKHKCIGLRKGCAGEPVEVWGSEGRSRYLILCLLTDGCKVQHATEACMTLGT